MSVLDFDLVDHVLALCACFVASLFLLIARVLHSYWKQYELRRNFRRDWHDVLLDREDRQAAISLFIARWGGQVKESQQWRSTFRDTMMTFHHDPTNHTHATSAGARSTGSRTCASIARMMGKEPYYYQKSFSDEKLGFEGSRTWYWAKDMHIPLSNDVFTEDHVKVMVDVDYYLDMPRVLGTAMTPLLMYTFQPTSPSAARGDYSYTCKDDTFHYTTSGGGSYRHKVWHYGHDSFVADMEVEHPVLGTVWKHTAYAVERRQIDADHQILALVPVRWWLSPTNTQLIDSEKLVRLKVTHGDFNVLSCQTLGTNKTSISGNGDLMCVTVDTTELQGLRYLNTATSVGLTLAGVQRVFQDLGVGQASLVMKYVQSAFNIKPITTFPVEHASRGYTFKAVDHDFDAKPALISFMCPFLHEAFNPNMHVGNERAAIDERVNKIKNDTQLDPRYDRMIEEFIKLAIPTPHYVVPTTDEEVYQRQDRPTQRAILQRAGIEDKNVIQSFMKRESYGEVKPPRVISTVNPTVKLNYSRFMYPVADHVSLNCDWYAFCRTPESIAKRVADVCSEAQTVLSTDLSRFDGRMSPACRAFEARFMLRLLKKEFHAEFLELHGKQMNLKAYGKFGTKYHTGWTRCSGSSETAIFNSLLNAMMAYCAIRECHPTLTPAEAYAMLGVYGGDDGLTRDVNPTTYTTVCARWGHKLTPERFEKGQSGVNFLARIYSPDVWFGSRDSMCDLRRTLSKLHTTVALPSNITPADKLLEKARSMMSTDANTPLLGEYCRQVVKRVAVSGRVTEDQRKSLWNYVAYENRASSEGRYPNSGDMWMLDVLNSQLHDVDVDKFFKYLDDLSREPDDVIAVRMILAPPLMARLDTIPVPEGVVVDGMEYRPQKRGSAKQRSSKRRKSKSPARQ